MDQVKRILVAKFTVPPTIIPSWWSSKTGTGIILYHLLLARILQSCIICLICFQFQFISLFAISLLFAFFESLMCVIFGLHFFCVRISSSSYATEQCLGSIFVGSARFCLPGSGSTKICGSTDPDPRAKISTKKCEKKNLLLKFKSELLKKFPHF